MILALYVDLFFLYMEICDHVAVTLSSKFFYRLESMLVKLWALIFLASPLVEIGDHVAVTEILNFLAIPLTLNSTHMKHIELNKFCLTRCVSCVHIWKDLGSCCFHSELLLFIAISLQIHTDLISCYCHSEFQFSKLFYDQFMNIR